MRLILNLAGWTLDLAFGRDEYEDAEPETEETGPTVVGGHLEQAGWTDMRIGFTAPSVDE